MEKKHSLFQRITSATPTFFKRVQTFALGLAALGGSLAAITAYPQRLSPPWSPLAPQ